MSSYAEKCHDIPCPALGDPFYTPNERAQIRALPEYVDRPGRGGARRKNRRGEETLSGYFAEAVVGKPITTPGHMVWRAVNAAGDVLLAYKTSKWHRIRFEDLVPVEEIPTYTMFQGMLNRCYETTCGSYYYYGARGIEVEESTWRPDGEHVVNGSREGRREAFENFKAWVIEWGYGSLPPAGVELSRPDDLGNYGPWCKALDPEVHRAETIARRNGTVRATNLGTKSKPIYHVRDRYNYPREERTDGA
jgi:hypothetical protein